MSIVADMPAGHRLADRLTAGAGGSARRQRGAASTALWFLLLLVLTGSAMVLDRVRLAVTANVATSAVTAKALADAKSALIAWSVTAYAGSGGQTTPGLLPFPDRNRDGNYDGKGDCVTFGLNPSHLLGRLP